MAKPGAKPIAGRESPGIEKAPTGIAGLDEITNGGLPRGRPTLVCGGPGCGKTLMAMEFLVRGATQFDEPGVFMSFEESSADLADNVRSLGFDLPALIDSGRIAMDQVIIDAAQFEETGEYDLEGLFVRLGFAIDAIGARRVVLDTIESLFGGLQNEAILRSELVRLFRWLKDRGVTTVITGERGAGSLTRQGLEEYVSDCVLLLDHRVDQQVSTRRMRIVKYRGTSHGTNEYPFLIDHRGFAVLPITGLGLAHEVSSERISTGIPRLDAMLEGRGYYRGSSILVSGTAGSGKTTFATSFASATCERGERCLYFAFEESPAQIMRNMASVGLDLAKWVRKGLLRFHSARPTGFGIEEHLVQIHRDIEDFAPSAVIMDPMSALLHSGSERQANAAILRLVDSLKSDGITAFFVSLTHGGEASEQTQLQVSSLMDTWLLLRDMEVGGERNRGLYVLKSRGMAHSNQIREFRIIAEGVTLLDVYAGPEGVLTGSARLAQEARESADKMKRRQEIERRRRDLQRQRGKMEAAIEALREEFEQLEQDTLNTIAQLESRESQIVDDRTAMARARHADDGAAANVNRGSRPRTARQRG